MIDENASKRLRLFSYKNAQVWTVWKQNENASLLRFLWDENGYFLKRISEVGTLVWYSLDQSAFVIVGERTRAGKSR